MSEETESGTEMAEETVQNDGQAAAPEPAEQPAPPAPAQEGGEASSEADALGMAALGSLVDVPLRLTVEVGATRMLVREVLQLNKGSVVPLDRMSGDPADILVNGRLVARGEVTMLDDSVAVRVVELVGAKPGERDR